MSKTNTQVLSFDNLKRGRPERNKPAMHAAKEIIGERVTASSALKEPPTDDDIEQFQSQLNMVSIKSLATAFKTAKTSLDKPVSLKEFRNFLNNSFENKPHERLVLAMFERFKVFRLEGDREN